MTLPLNPSNTGRRRGALRLVLAAVIGAATALLGTAAGAQTWPAKPIRLLQPAPAGGGPELVTRSMAHYLQQRLGQPVVVDYKPGAGGNLAAAELLRSGPDGYTLMLGPENILTINPLIYKNLGFNKADLMPLNLVGSFTQVLVCHPSVGVKTVAELIAKAKSTKLSYASGGQGSPGHLTMEMLLHEAGADMTHVPYRGPAPAVQDLIGGQVQCGFLVGAIVGEHLKSGRLVGIATSGAQRTPGAAQLPTVAEAGYPGVNATFWLTIFVPRGLDPAVQAKLSQAVADAVRSPEVREALATVDTIAVGAGPDVAQKELDALAQRWAEVAKRVNLRLD